VPQTDFSASKAAFLYGNLTSTQYFPSFPHLEPEMMSILPNTLLHIDFDGNSGLLGECS
jgi:hypothetical protein